MSEEAFCKFSVEIKVSMKHENNVAINFSCFTNFLLHLETLRIATKQWKTLILIMYSAPFKDYGLQRDMNNEQSCE